MSRVNYLLICENVIKAERAKVSLINVYDETSVKSLPVVAGKFVIAIDVRLDRSEVEDEEVRFSLTMTAPDGKVTPIASGVGKVPKDVQAKHNAVGVITSLDLTGKLTFESEGPYVIDLFIYDEKLASTTLTIKQTGDAPE